MVMHVMQEKIATPRDLAMRDIKVIAELHGVDIEGVVGPSRKRKHAHARFEAMAHIRETYGWSLSRIGRLFSGRDHTTVLNAIRRHKERTS